MKILPYFDLFITSFAVDAIFVYGIFGDLLFSLLRMYPMSYASSLSTTPTRSLILHAIFSQTGPPRRVDAWTRYGSLGVNYLSEGHNDTLPIQQPNRELPTCALIHYAALSLAGICVSVFPKDTTARCAQCGHRASNFTINSRRPNRLIYIAAFCLVTGYCLVVIQLLSFSVFIV